MVNPVELPEKCPHCEYQSVEQGKTFEFATITVRRGQQQEPMVDGFKCAKCGRRLDISHCNIKLTGT